MLSNIYSISTELYYKETFSTIRLSYRISTSCPGFSTSCLVLIPFYSLLSIYNSTNISAVVEYSLAMPDTNAAAERIFLTVNMAWTNETNHVFFFVFLVKTIKSNYFCENTVGKLFLWWVLWYFGHEFNSFFFFLSLYLLR